MENGYGVEQTELKASNSFKRPLRQAGVLGNGREMGPGSVNRKNKVLVYSFNFTSTAVDSSATTNCLDPGSVICITFMPEFFGCFLFFKRTFELGSGGARL